MKVFFTFGGLPHYHNALLSRLHHSPGLEIGVIIPQGDTQALGTGVHTTKDKVDFPIFPLTEKKAWYGKPAFIGLAELLEKEKPDALVTCWPYATMVSLNFKLQRTIKRLGIKLIYKDIPFNIPVYSEALAFYTSPAFQTETLEKASGPVWLQKLKYVFVREIIRNYLRRMDAHVYYTDEAFRIIPTYGVAKEKIVVVYNSPDTDHFLRIRTELEHKGTLEHNPYRLLHVGRLVKWKRVDLLLYAAKRLKASFPLIELSIVGAGPELENLKAIVADWENPEWIKFKGAIYDPLQLGKTFMESGLYVLAGMGGMSINEAMCFGKPIVCSIADGTEKKLVREGVNGAYFTEGNEDSLYQALYKLLQNPQHLERMGEASTRIIKEEVNIHIVVNRYREAFKLVAKDKDPIHQS